MIDIGSGRNEIGQESTLAELAAKSTANEKVRRAVLMTRIAGFERIAVASSHAGLFLTMTCPSRFVSDRLRRFHWWRAVNEGKVVIPNPIYEPNEKPATAQKHLARVWSRIPAELKRRDKEVYGVRIAEPQHGDAPPMATPNCSTYGWLLQARRPLGVVHGVADIREQYPLNRDIARETSCTPAFTA